MKIATPDKVPLLSPGQARFPGCGLKFRVKFGVKFRVRVREMVRIRVRERVTELE